MNMKPETIQVIIDLTHAIAQAHFEMYRAKTWGQDLTITQWVDEYIQLLIKAIQEDAMWQVSQWKEERDYIRSLEAQVKAILELEEQGCIHPHHDQAYHQAIQSERDFYGLDD
jgi:hypothetical protein